MVIVHGYKAHPGKHWFRWLADRATSSGDTVVIPTLPHSDAPDAGEWNDALADAVGEVDESTLIVTHSLGGVTALRYLSGLAGEWTLGGCVAVAGFVDPIPGLEAVDGFCIPPVDVEQLVPRLGHVAVLHSDNDEVVPPRLSVDLARRLGVEPIVVSGAGHFCEQEGIDTVPELLDVVERIRREL